MPKCLIDLYHNVSGILEEIGHMRRLSWIMYIVSQAKESHIRGLPSIVHTVVSHVKQSCPEGLIRRVTQSLWQF